MCAEINWWSKSKSTLLPSCIKPKCLTIVRRSSFSKCDFSPRAYTNFVVTHWIRYSCTRQIESKLSLFSLAISFVCFV
ncbi:hypothetical protein C3L57_08555 [Veillonellaceae bacterium M2-8]|nr:hypothetical protein [Veillonellaceae bacterium M2-8]